MFCAVCCASVWVFRAAKSGKLEHNSNQLWTLWGKLSVNEAQWWYACVYVSLFQWQNWGGEGIKQTQGQGNCLKARRRVGGISGLKQLCSYFVSFFKSRYPCSQICVCQLSSFEFYKHPPNWQTLLEVERRPGQCACALALQRSHLHFFCFLQWNVCFFFQSWFHI